MTDSASTLEHVNTGEWLGWRLWNGEPFEQVAGPFYAKGEDSESVCAFRVERRHLNGSGDVHGGALAAFADFAIFGLSEGYWMTTGGVTVGLSCQYIGAVKLGDLVEARSRSLQEAAGMLFITALATVNSVPVLTFTGIIKKRPVRNILDNTKFASLQSET